MLARIGGVLSVAFVLACGNAPTVSERFRALCERINATCDQTYDCSSSSEVVVRAASECPAQIEAVLSCSERLPAETLCQPPLCVPESDAVNACLSAVDAGAGDGGT